MRFFDRQRPLSDNIPLGQWPSGGTFGLPVLYVEPAEAAASAGPDDPPDASWIVTAYMPMSSNAFSGFTARFGSKAELFDFFARWLADPERELLETFKYDPSSAKRKERVRTAVRTKVIASGLAALGLDD